MYMYIILDMVFGQVKLIGTAFSRKETDASFFILVHVILIHVILVFDSP